MLRDVYNVLSEEEKQTNDKLPSDQLESCFTLLERHIAPMSNELPPAEELRTVQQGSLTEQEVFAKVFKIVKNCKFSNKKAERRAFRDAIYCELSSQYVKKKAVNLEEEVTLEFLMRHARKEDSIKRHFDIHQINSTASVSYIYHYDRMRETRREGNAEM